MRNRYIFLIDLPAIAVGASAAFLLRFDWKFVVERREFLPFLGMVLVLKPIVDRKSTRLNSSH